MLVLDLLVVCPTPLFSRIKIVRLTVDGQVSLALLRDNAI